MFDLNNTHGYIRPHNNICVFLCQSNSGWYIKMHEMDLPPGNLIWMNLSKGKNYL